MRVCVEPGCGALCETTRCATHTRAKDKSRGTRQQRGYDRAYDARRRADVQAMANGTVLSCWRCGEVVLPHDYSLGHCDDSKQVIHGAEHYHQCNQANARSLRLCPHESHGVKAPLPGYPGVATPRDRGLGVSYLRVPLNLNGR